MIWFTADHHFAHANIIKYCERPFESTLEMDLAMTERWNEVVSHNDYVYHLGDFYLGNQEAFDFYRLRLNGRIYFLPGGHDKNWISGKLNFDYSPYTLSGGKDRVLLPIVTLSRKRLQKQSPTSITLCHYPMLSWHASHHGSLHLHGHSHGNVGIKGNSHDVNMQERPTELKQGIRIDVGVDNWNFYPVSLTQVLEEAGLSME